jgi:hypothetical protein
LSFLTQSPIYTHTGYKNAEREAIRISQTSTYRDKYIHIEWIEDNYYQINVYDTYLGDGNSDIIGCYRNGEYVKSHQEMIDEVDLNDSYDVTEAQMQEQEQPDEPDYNEGPMWSDDMYY